MHAATLSLPVSVSRIPASAPRTAAAVSELDFATFYEANIGQLVGTFTATLGDPVLAQDAAHEAMTRACQHWTKVGGYRNPFGWCYRVGLNWSTSRWRKRRREVTTGTFTFEPSMFDGERIDESVVQALLKLPVDQRAVVVLRIWMDWSIADTADALGIAEGTVRSRLSRALERLRTLIDDPKAGGDDD